MGTLPDKINRSYEGLYPGIVTTGLNLLLICSYGTALLLNQIGQGSVFSRIDLITLHQISGYLILTILGLILYDQLQGKLRLEQKLTLPWILPETYNLRQWVDRIFIALLSLLALTGLFHHLGTGPFSPWFPHPTTMLIYHQLLSWLFLAILITKFYLDFTFWLGKILVYLREY